MPPSLFESDDFVAYVVNDTISPSRTWNTKVIREDRHQIWHAPDPIIRDLVEVLNTDPAKVQFIINPDDKYEKTHTFRTRGFSEAAKPVLEACK